MLSVCSNPTLQILVHRNTQLAEPRRRRQKTSTSSEAAPLPPYITRTAPVYDILNVEQITAIEEAAEDILERIGVEVRHEASLTLLREAGCHVDGERVKFDRGFCRKLVMENAPSEFIQHARNPVKSVKIGGDSMVLVPIYGPPFVASVVAARSAINGNITLRTAWLQTRNLF